MCVLMSLGLTLMCVKENSSVNSVLGFELSVCSCPELCKFRVEEDEIEGRFLY